MTPSPPIISVRAIDPVTGEPMYGNGQANFLTNGAAVAQIIGTKLKLLQGEWWLNTAEGTPLWQTLLSHAVTLGAVALIFQNIILSVPYVVTITSSSVEYLPQARSFSFTALVQTAFGAVPVGPLSLPGVG